MIPCAFEKTIFFRTLEIFAKKEGKRMEIKVFPDFVNASINSASMGPGAKHNNFHI